MRNQPIKQSENRHTHRYTYNRRNTSQHAIIIALCCVLFLFSGCQQEEAVVEKPSFPQSTKFPVVFAKDGDTLFSPILPRKTRMDMADFKEAAVYISDKGLYLGINEDAYFNGIYNIYERETLAPIFSNDIIVGFNSDSANEIYIGKGNMEPEKQYIMELELRTAGGTKGYYYLDLMLGEARYNGNLLRAAKKIIDENDIDAENRILGEPNIWFMDIHKNEPVVKIQYTKAKVVNNETFYFERNETFTMSPKAITPNLIGMEEMLKSRNIYDAKKGGYVISKDPSREYLKSSNERFIGLYTEKELLYYTVETQHLYEVYRTDLLNDDYIKDEYQQHKIHPLGIHDSGRMYFLVLGYMNDASSEALKNGIAFYSFTPSNGVKLHGFYESNESVVAIENKIKEVAYFNTKERTMYYYDNGYLYSFSFDKNQLEFVDYYLGATYYPDSGIIAWEEKPNSKFNDTIYFVDLARSVDVLRPNLYAKNDIYVKLEDIYNRELYIGLYNPSDTYETSDQKITYPYYKINRVDLNLSKVEEYTRNGMFLDGIHRLEENQLATNILRLEKEKKAQPEDNKVKYSIEKKDVILYEYEEIPEIVKQVEVTKLNPQEVNDQLRYKTNDDVFMPTKENTSNKNMNRLNNEIEKVSIVERDHYYVIQTLEKEKEKELPVIARLYKENEVYFDFQELINKEAFVVRTNTGVISYEKTFKDALHTAQTLEDKETYRIGKLDFEDGLLLETIWLDTTIRENKVIIRDFEVISQYPKLSRGSAFASLYSYLTYYEKEVPAFDVLARKTPNNITKYKVEEGELRFGDMHEEFAGSPYNISLKGLGIYIEPLIETAKEYHEEAVNATGISLEQLKILLSSGHIAIVTVAEDLEGETSAKKEDGKLWVTPNGYMEVMEGTNTVLIMGYNEKYVYYMNTEEGKLQSVPVAKFENAWDLLGRQAMVSLVQKVNE